VPALALAALLASDAALERAREALQAPGARTTIVGWHATLPPGCGVVRAEPLADPRRERTVGVRLLGTDVSGRPCAGWGRAEVRVAASVLVATRAVAEGEPLEGAFRTEERELAPGAVPVGRVAPQSVAARPLAAGTILEECLAKSPAPRAGESIPVRLVLGAVAASWRGTALACPGGACARLPSGRRVRGRWTGGVLEVEAP